MILPTSSETTNSLELKGSTSTSEIRSLYLMELEASGSPPKSQSIKEILDDPEAWSAHRIGASVAWLKIWGDAAIESLKAEDQAILASVAQKRLTATDLALAEYKLSKISENDEQALEKSIGVISDFCKLTGLTECSVKALILSYREISTSFADEQRAQRSKSRVSRKTKSLPATCAEAGIGSTKVEQDSRTLITTPIEVSESEIAFPALEPEVAPQNNSTTQPGIEEIALIENSLNTNLESEVPNSAVNPAVDTGLILPQIEIQPTGDQIDYDFTVKILWRQKWKEFLSKNFTPQELQVAKVLCLPGRAVEREVSIYLSLGVAAENILAVEGSSEPAVREEFMRNCLRLGIEGRLGRLENIVPKLSTPFNIVSYDFHGPYSNLAQEIAENTPIADKVAVLVNLLGKREKSQAQERLARLHIGSKELVAKAGSLSEIRKMTRDISEETRNAWIRKKTEDLSSLRLDYADGLVTQMISAARYERITRYLDRLLTLENVRNVSRAERFIPTSQGHYNDCARFDMDLWNGLKKDFNLKMTPRFDYVMWGAAPFITSSHLPLISAQERYSYSSEGGRGGSPFYSSFKLFETPTALYKRCAPTADFFLNILVAVNDQLKLNDGAFDRRWIRREVYKGDGKFLKLGEHLRPRHQIVVSVKGKKVASIGVAECIYQSRACADYMINKTLATNSSRESNRVDLDNYLS